MFITTGHPPLKSLATTLDPHWCLMRRPYVFIFTAVFAATLMSATAFLSSSPAIAAPIADAPITYCADPDTDPSMDTGAGTMITCVTEVTNTVTAINSGVATGTAHVRVTECRGPANGRLDPSDLTCTTDEKDLVGLVTRVDQCNEVGYGGGNVLECSVDVTTNFVGVSPQAILDATVNQCNVPQFAGLDKTGCNPYPATTTNATVTQCNDSSYGGGQEDFNCIAPNANETTSALSVEVNQCNNSNYGGGSWLNCRTDLAVEVFLQETPPPTEVPTASPAPTATASPAPTSTASPAPTPTEAPTAVITPSPAPVTPAPTGDVNPTPTAVNTSTPAPVTPAPTGDVNPTPTAVNTSTPAPVTPAPTGDVTTPAPTGDVNATATPSEAATDTPELPDTSTSGTPGGTPTVVSLLLLASLLLLTITAWKSLAPRIRRSA